MEPILENTDWYKIKSDTATLYLELAEKRLIETNDTSKINNDRVDKILTLSITLMTAILTYLGIDGWGTVGTEYINTVFAIMILFLIVSLYLLIKNLLPASYGTIGEEPRFIMKKEFIEEHDNEYQVVNLICHMCDMYQNKIHKNTQINIKRVNRTKRAIIIIVSSLSSFLWGYLYLTLKDYYL